MAEYLSPGVYVEEVDAGPKPIEGVSTSTTGAVGVTARGPTDGKPKLVTSFTEFERTFGTLDEFQRVYGEYLKDPSPVFKTWSDVKEGGYWWRFPLSVRGFFDNGGKRLYVKRVFSGTAKAASGSLGQGLVAEIDTRVAPGERIVALRHLFGIAKTPAPLPAAGAFPPGTYQIIRDGIPTQRTGAAAPIEYEVVWYNPDARRVKFNESSGLELKPDRDYVQIVGPTAAGAKTTLTFTAKEKGGWGNALAVRVRPVVGATLSLLPDVSNHDVAYTSKISKDGVKALWTVTLDTGGAVGAGAEITINDVPYHIDAAEDANNAILVPENDIAKGLAWKLGETVVKIAGKPVAKILDTQAIVEVNVVDGLPAAMAKGDRMTINGKDYPLSEAAAAADKKFKVDLVPLVAVTWEQGTTVSKTRRARNGAKLDINAAEQLYPNALVEFDNGTAKEYAVITDINGNVVAVNSALANTYYEGQRLRVIEAEVGVRKLNADNTVADEEVFSNLRLSQDTTMNYLVNNVNENSKYVNVVVGGDLWDDPNARVFADLRKFPTAPGGGWLRLGADAATKGTDAIEGLSVDDFVGTDGGSGNRTGIQALEDIDEVSLCIVPGMWSAAIQAALINHCERLKDRFAILDPRVDLDIEGIRAFRDPLDTKYAALYHPWVEVRDPMLKRDVKVGPSGHMAGLYARVDGDRGVHKAPANETIGVITKITDDVSQREQDLLNPKGINALRFFPGRGNRVWGARTLTSDPSWKYINVRRLFIFVEKSIQNGTQWVVFEPNDESLWSRVRQTVENFLDTVWRSGALQGLTAKEAFFVKCDLGVTMTQADIDNGRLIIQIGIAPVKPAEFVIFRIQQKTLEAQPS